MEEHYRSSSVGLTFSLGKSNRILRKREQKDEAKRLDQLREMKKRHKRVEVFKLHHPDETVPMLFTDDGWSACESIEKTQDPSSVSMRSGRRGTFFGLYPFGKGSLSLQSQQDLVRRNRDKACEETMQFKSKFSIAEQFDIAKEARVLQPAGRGGNRAHLISADLSGCMNPVSRGFHDYLDERRQRMLVKEQEASAHFERLIKAQSKDGGNPRARHAKSLELNRMLRYVGVRS